MSQQEATSDDDSDYCVEQYVKPKRVRRAVNDDSADLLGNFDDAKRNEILEGTYMDEDSEASDADNNAASDNANSTEVSEEEVIEDGSDEEKETIDKESEDNEDDDEDAVTDNIEGSKAIEQLDEQQPQLTGKKENKNLSKEQLNSLLRGAAKANRFVLYVTNLNFETTRADLETHFGVAGAVKSVRIPKKRRGGFAFVEMCDVEGFHSGFQLHNSDLQGRQIKVQISEGGKKKSANKKNILKQKNRKLAEMRNENKFFTKSGKFYDKTLKKEKAKDLMARKRWRKPAAAAAKPK